MDTYEKNTAMHLLPYGVHVLTAPAETDETDDDDMQAVGAVVSWVTQASFSPPLLVVALRVGSRIHAVVRQSRCFALNILDRNHVSVTRSFFDTVYEKGGTLAGQSFRIGQTGAPILDCAAGYIECSLDLCLDKGDHSIFVAEVVDAGIAATLPGPPNEVSLMLRDFGSSFAYGD